MKKMLIGGTIILTTALLVTGLTNPGNPLMWLASTSIQYELIRAVLIGILVVLLFTNPPRALYFRAFLGVGAACLGVGTIVLLATYEMNLIDAVVFSEIAIIFAIEALEVSEEYSHVIKVKQTNALQ